MIWEIAARDHALPDALSRPTTIFVAWGSEIADGSLARMIAQTLVPAVAGWTLGSLLAVAAGIAIGMLPPLRAAVGLTFDWMRSVPPVALIPVALLALGLGPKLEIFMIAFSIFWPVTVFTAAGVHAIDPRLLEVARALRFSPARRALQFVLPAASPSIALGLRVAAGLALVIAVTTEIIANPSGIGYGIAISATTIRPDLMFANLFTVAILGFAINLGMVSAERRVFTWTGR